jgi:Amt family ammonium transporter
MKKLLASLTISLSLLAAGTAVLAQAPQAAPAASAPAEAKPVEAIAATP